MSNLKNLISFFIPSFILTCCCTNNNLQVVNHVNLNRYTGKWYEIARLPNSFEKGLKCITATYTLREDGKIDVLNKGINIENGNTEETAKGIAFVPDKASTAKLKVSFFRPFYGKYQIIALDEKDYQYALVGEPSRKYLWILCRDKMMDESTYTLILNIAKDLGFDVSKMIKTEQDCE